MEKVSVIIPTYNCFKYLLNTIKSVKQQTYKNIEIIVINDCSTQQEYYNHDWKKEGVTILHLEKNTKQIFGFACAGYIRKRGIDISTGTYIAFCDDDDIWFDEKIELQMKAMKRTGCKMSATEGLIGSGPYDNNKDYKIYNAEHYYDIIHSYYLQKGSNLLDNGYPEIWDLYFLKIHNCVIASSAIVSKDILVNYNCIADEPNGTGHDYRIWLRVLEHTNCVYVNDICFYYDDGHADGQYL